jgi:hypothetical protein
VLELDWSACSSPKRLRFALGIVRRLEDSAEKGCVSPRH